MPNYSVEFLKEFAAVVEDTARNNLSSEEERVWMHNASTVEQISYGVCALCATPDFREKCSREWQEFSDMDYISQAEFLAPYFNRLTY